jgi:hypothetical protein
MPDQSGTAPAKISIRPPMLCAARPPSAGGMREWCEAKGIGRGQLNGPNVSEAQCRLDYRRSRTDKPRVFK